MKKIIKVVFLGLLTAVLIIIALAGIVGDGILIDTFGDDSKKSMVEDIRTAMTEGKSTVTVRYIGKRDEIQEYAGEAVEKAMSMDDASTSSDFDYLRHIYRGYEATMRGFACYAEIKYNFSYSETAEQTAWVDKKVKELIKQFDFENKSAYEKVKTIHDYIIENISYDVTASGNSAYEGLYNHKAACEGYANLAYKMITEAGVPCRVITGTANAEAHAWNIVEIDGLWYNIDCTWDDPIGGDEKTISYQFFLKSNYDLKDHIRDSEYDTDIFNTQYPIAATSYAIEKE